jgi:mannose-6-phosphate isomerase-like protein (cupin superfamily)
MENFFSVDEIRQRIRGPIPYAEFLRIPAMSCGLYVLEPGEEDMQRPHDQDEIYYFLSGAAHIRVAAANRPPEDRTIAPGHVIFVAAHDEHKFHSITQELVLLVVFAPAMTG